MKKSEVEYRTIGKMVIEIGFEFLCERHGGTKTNNMQKPCEFPDCGRMTNKGQEYSKITTQKN